MLMLMFKNCYINSFVIFVSAVHWLSCTIYTICVTLFSHATNRGDGTKYVIISCVHKSFGTQNV